MSEQANSDSSQYTSQGVVAGSIPLFAGHPSPDLLPIEAIQHVLNQSFEQSTITRMFNYGNEQGDLDLISFLVDRFNQKEDLRLTTDNMMIMGGSTGGVTMITNLLTQPDDTILVDAPSYRDALHIFRDAGLDMYAIPIDDQGIVIDEMKKTLGKLEADNRLPKFYYVVPTFQNPSGITLTRDRREAIIQLSQDYNFLIVEDDVYSEIRFVDDIPPSFYELAEGNNVLRLGTFSKTLSPGMRLGWLMADADRIDQFVNCGVSAMGGGANPFTAKLVADYCKQGGWDKHILWLREQYQARRDVALNALREYMPDNVSWTYPEGGYFIWITLPDTIRVSEFEHVANEHNVYFAPGTGFFVNPEQGEQHIRISFSYVSSNDMRKGIQILAQLIRKHAK